MLGGAFFYGKCSVFEVKKINLAWGARGGGNPYKTVSEAKADEHHWKKVKHYSEEFCTCFKV